MHKVDKRLCTLFVLCALGHAHGVIKQIDTFLRKAATQIRIVVLHQDIIAGIIGGKGILPAFHQVEHLIHHIHRAHRVLLLGKQLRRRVPILLRGGVQILSQHELSQGKSISGIVKHQHLVPVLFVPQHRPAFRRFFHQLFVINQHRGANVVAHGVLLLGVKIQPLAVRGNILVIIGNIAVVQRQQHILLQQALDHIVRRNDHVIGHTAAGQLGIHIFV